ncbi:MULTISPECIES: threonine-phosphate decarboxylase CobD [unclassified Ectothiorhodospira]|uniref:threonine-phosphate decarboxylase CobD n=1 Tax=unclassified Ectothiorhodospira TaxID=2684909 RepID=UPI001EE7A7B5|nr:MULTISPECIES: threonine-phosphate decarboxylase CobD [unclassified Ectothiorhodospira]MCG5516062.1 threonine-phosphate decarboxylase CobD [Ectothiorhodospira sp. 9100]MCG5519030.1 threonine-phosphate decarboxylase CobD [Ectothiorhodospira sp. 9905]
MTQSNADNPTASSSAPFLPHGGRLRAAAREEGIPLEEWLDLSTGINPNGWPVPAVPTSQWMRLPEEDDGLEAAATHYYGSDPLLPVAGSQAAIQALPTLLPPGRCVGVLHPSYGEHAHAWKQAGHTVRALAPETIEEHLPALDVLLLVYPNNPTGALFDPARLQSWHQRLADKGGWLIIDEAFMDATPERSLAPTCPQPGLIVLRSLGKFFGLAGARVGFVFAEVDIRQRLAAALGPWTVTGPSRWVATQALEDRDWQEQTRFSLYEAGARLRDCLDIHGLPPDGGTSLFQWGRTDQAREIHQALRRQGILTRLFTDPLSLRFGLPADESQWQRLEDALKEVLGASGA